MSGSDADDERPEPEAVRTPAVEATGVRVRAHPGLCEGWGNCHRWAPAVYPLDEDGQIAIHLLDVPAELASAAWSGADACPAQAITVIGERPPPAWTTASADEGSGS